MKKTFFLLFGLIFLNSQAQTINFPDAGFKARLMTSGPLSDVAQNQAGNRFKIDANNDGNIQVNEAQQVKILNISYGNANISDVSGIEYFTNLQELSCEFNSIGSLSFTGLGNLTKLVCNHNQLAILNVAALTNLNHLNCSDNQIAVLPVGALTNLTHLECDHNLLTSLAVDNLVALKSLSCSNNQLSSLNVGNLVNLNSLYCNSNQLSALEVANLAQLFELGCSYNMISSLNVTAMTNLGALMCGGNQLAALDLSGQQGLLTLDCSGNHLTSLDVSGNTLLQYLQFSNNQIASIAVTGLADLQTFACDNNLLTTLDVSGQHQLYELWCYNNQLTSLFLKNGSDESGALNFDGNPNLQYICADDDQLSSVQDLIAQFGYTNCFANSYCSFTPGGVFYTINGTERFDGNSNGCDASDTLYPNLKLNISGAGNSGGIICNTSGNYSFPVQEGSHTVTPVLENPDYFAIYPAMVTANFPAAASPLVQNFCIVPNGSHPDLEIAILPLSRARPGFDATYKITYKNKGTQALSGTVNFAFNDAVSDFVTSSPAYSMQSLNYLIWNFSDLQPFESREVMITLNLNSPTEIPALNSGFVLNFTASINGGSLEDTPEDNVFAMNQTVVNSFDPNDKTCIEGAVIAPSQIGKELHYIIRFENTGSANAENIVVADQIDTEQFDISTLIPISGSHPFTTRITNGNKAEFIFENINLPFDDAHSDGYVAFKIKTNPTISAGDSVSNTASIYFDYNAPIVTNTATTTVNALAKSDFDFENYLRIYPNPVQDSLNIESKNQIQLSSVNIYNTLGQLVLAVPNAKGLKAIDVSNLKAGNYFISVKSDKGTSNSKFIKR